MRKKLPSFCAKHYFRNKWCYYLRFFLRGLHLLQKKLFFIIIYFTNSAYIPETRSGHSASVEYDDWLAAPACRINQSINQLINNLINQSIHMIGEG